jgi:hypothetical protein
MLFKQMFKDLFQAIIQPILQTWKGQNRNLDFRRTFHEYIEKTPIKATTIFNGPLWIY